jgi:hypothetical protein
MIIPCNTGLQAPHFILPCKRFKLLFIQSYSHKVLRYFYTSNYYKEIGVRNVIKPYYYIEAGESKIISILF